MKPNNSVAETSAVVGPVDSPPDNDPTPGKFLSAAASLWMLAVLLIFLFVRVFDSATLTHALHQLGYR